jgi:hypothetical protein
MKAPKSFIEFLRGQNPEWIFSCMSSRCPIAKWLKTFPRWENAKIGVGAGSWWTRDPGEFGKSHFLPLWAYEFIKWHDRGRPSVGFMLKNLEPL